MSYEIESDDAKQYGKSTQLILAAQTTRDRLFWQFQEGCDLRR